MKKIDILIIIISALIGITVAEIHTNHKNIKKLNACKAGLQNCTGHLRNMADIITNGQYCESVCTGQFEKYGC